MSRISEEKMELYALVGQGISIWTATEAVLAEMFADLLGTTPEKAGLVIYSVGNFHSWLTLIDELLAMDDRLKDKIDEWGPIAEKLKRFNDTRVRLAHHTSFDFKNNDPIIALRPAWLDTRSKSRKYKPLDTDQIEKFNEDLALLFPKVVHLQSRVRMIVSSL